MVFRRKGPIVLKGLTHSLRPVVWEDIFTPQCKDGRDIHVDNIIPLSLYELQDEHDPMLKKAWSLSNLQLLPAVENRGKGNAIPWELIAERDLFDLLPEDVPIPGEYARREEVS